MVKARSSSDIRKGYIAKLRESEKLLPQLTRPREAQTASANGKVFIITNASEGWVQHSSSMCFPNLQPLLAPVVIISARAGFETQYPGDSHAWKMHAFLKVQDQLQLEAVTNLVSVGDSHIEMDAVKLWERPTPYELQKQLEVVADKLPDIYTSGATP
ncbi:hypothetical protein EMIHUDRAFT_250349 [Emiliania huxleyi CCMP1516]|uniref:Uncharacterized protein n=2 Tax=Emiliania huxleyi TaxID=2903 RepID=A0A0D3I1B4_EMIH1|nr:hypothetical protein EMIHUDRAFT_250349 [Emiliania huxleyi CCMP1516]EOD05049.1 hypothetical protein EMIHUDRAFT_250349 [Emiliania huxleyi CCMP1516]|eukprot:XP_005757478.1 hypothetical protein EMIHUDRAFT_250349 [Emiliania huxleyi CCMP1516]